MSFSPEFLEELRDRLRLSDVVGRKVRLMKKGREFSGLCPFHSEKTPSFTVNDDKHFYHCFGCGAHGDAIRFLTDSEGLPFREAVERLAGEVGLDLPVTRPQDRELQERRANLYDANETAAKWFEAQIWSPAGREALAYLRQRGLTDATIKAFRIGLAPAARTALRDGMVARGLTQPLLEEAGLLIVPEGEREGFDRFRNRIMFPIADNRNRVVAFGGRALDDAPAKYLNSPETPLFHKGRMLYNLTAARGPARDRGQIIVVEGYMDVISLAQAGFQEAVAPLGTAVTEDQIAEMWKVVPEPILCFDGDNAGRRAAARAIDRAIPHLKPGHSLRFALLPQGEDPDSFVQTKGVEAFSELLRGGSSLVDMLWEGLLEAHPTDTPERRAGFERAAYETIGRITDAKVKRFYEVEFRDRMSALFRPQRNYDRAESSKQSRGDYGLSRPRTAYSIQRTQAAGRGGKGRVQSIWDRRDDPAAARISAARLKSTALGREGTGVRGRAREALILLCMVNHPTLLETHVEELMTLEFQNGDLDKLRAEIIRIAASEPGLDMSHMRDHLNKTGFGRLLDSFDVLLARDWFARSEAAQIDVEQGWKHVVALHQRSMSLERELKLVEDELAREFTDDAMARLQALKKQLEDSAGREANLAGFGIASGRGTTG